MTALERYHKIYKHDPNYKERKRAYLKQYRNETKARWKSYYQARRQKHVEMINRLKCRPCADCGVSYNPWIMEFDHRDPSQKKYNISWMVQQGHISWKAIERELEKCDLVCGNCHNERTYQRRQDNGRITQG